MVTEKEKNKVIDKNKEKNILIEEEKEKGEERKAIRD